MRSTQLLSRRAPCARCIVSGTPEGQELGDDNVDVTIPTAIVRGGVSSKVRTAARKCRFEIGDRRRVAY